MAISLTPNQRLKLDVLASGIDVDPNARAALTAGGGVTLTFNDYPTTGGLTLVLPDDIYVNAPVGEWYCGDPAAILAHDAERDTFVLTSGELTVDARPLPLPGYLQRPATETDGVMTHSDRARLSPIDGCSTNCAFCDSPLVGYELRPAEHLLAALQFALEDERLPPRHLLISGGTPRPADRAYLDDVYKRVIRESPIPVDVMLTSRTDTDVIDRLVDWGVFGLAINLELFNTGVAAQHTPYKQGLGLKEFKRCISRAVDLTGGNGRVRSLLLVGLEPPEDTLRGVRFLAELGCDPCLSPFRPALGTPLAGHPLPEASLMENLYLASREIAEEHSVKLGPRCIPCQHNTVAFPDDSGAYYYS